MRDEVERTRHYFLYLLFDVTKALTLTLPEGEGIRKARGAGDRIISDCQLTGESKIGNRKFIQTLLQE